MSQECYPLSQIATLQPQLQASSLGAGIAAGVHAWHRATCRVHVLLCMRWGTHALHGRVPRNACAGERMHCMGSHQKLHGLVPKNAWACTKKCMGSCTYVCTDGIVSAAAVAVQPWREVALQRVG
eukprot:365537-Chlamydomonas_euryale.AAC.5